MASPNIYEFIDNIYTVIKPNETKPLTRIKLYKKLLIKYVKMLFSISMNWPDVDVEDRYPSVAKNICIKTNTKIL